MLNELTCTCGGEGCERTLGETECRIVYETDAGERRVYECGCGAVTVTVHR